MLVLSLAGAVAFCSAGWLWCVLGRSERRNEKGRHHHHRCFLRFIGTTTTSTMTTFGGSGAAMWTDVVRYRKIDRLTESRLPFKSAAFLFCETVLLLLLDPRRLPLLVSQGVEKCVGIFHLLCLGWVKVSLILSLFSFCWDSGNHRRNVNKSCGWAGRIKKMMISSIPFGRSS